MTHDDYLSQLEPKELKAGLFDYKINGITVYKLVRRSLIEDKLRSFGIKVMEMKLEGSSSKIDNIVGSLSSLWQLLLLYVSRRKASTVFVAFPRIEKIEGCYVEKFVDPLVSLCFENNKDVIVLDPVSNVHAKPRINHKCHVLTQWFTFKSRLSARLNLRGFYNAHQSCLDSFYESLCSVFDLNFQDDNLRNSLFFKLLCLLKQIDCYKSLFQHLNCKRVIGPSRHFLRRFIIAAHLVGATSYELQHGVVYGITKDNTGIQPEECTPDYYLAYGESNSGNVQGVLPERIVNVGWAFSEYISTIKGFVQYQERDVLVISDPSITDKIIDVTLYLAKANPGCHFYVRPHPHEKITDAQKSRLESQPNAHWQDRHINIALVMRGFTHVIGENSTVVYEALDAGKKVGRLCFEAFHPRYLKEEDRDCFWEISDQESFVRFIEEDISAKKTKSIYSPFNKELFMQTIGINNSI